MYRRCREELTFASSYPALGTSSSISKSTFASPLTHQRHPSPSSSSLSKSRIHLSLASKSTRRVLSKSMTSGPNTLICTSLTASTLSEQLTQVRATILTPPSSVAILFGGNRPNLSFQLCRVVLLQMQVQISLKSVLTFSNLMNNLNGIVYYQHSICQPL